MILFKYKSIKDINIDRYIDGIPSYYVEKSKKMRQEGDRKLELLSGYLLKELLRELRIDEKIIIDVSKNGKPFLANSDLYFNVSHSKDTALVVISDVEIGCDIEKIDIGMDCLRIAKRFYAEDEYEYLLNIDDSKKRAMAFYKLWTMKEAFVKAIGIGLTMELNAVSFIDRELIDGKLIDGEFIDGKLIDGESVDKEPFVNKIDYNGQTYRFIPQNDIEGFAFTICIVN